MRLLLKSLAEAAHDGMATDDAVSRANAQRLSERGCCEWFVIEFIVFVMLDCHTDEGWVVGCDGVSVQNQAIDGHRQPDSFSERR